MDQIAVLIPCYNEEKTIAKVIADTKTYLPEAAVYVYDNNSTDDTARIAAENGAIVRREHKQGKGNVIRRMFREVDADCYILIDGDDTYPLESAREMADKVLLNGADMVVGDRLSSTYFSQNKRPFHGVGNSLVRGSINRLFRTDIRDIMTGYRALSYAFVKTFPVLSKGFEIETEMTIHAVFNNLQIENVIVEYRDRPEGSTSKLNTFSDGRKVLATIFRLYRDYKPMRFFTLIASVLFLLAVIFVVPVFIEYWQTGEVRRFPTLIVCGFTFVAALQSFFAGVILSSMALNHRRTFEYRMNTLEARRGRSHAERDT
ncbi:MAG: glycosyltransferase [Lachnospiraceae bacterium]|nr:glycosyltransferase [Lachnospiraceae bacterium]